MNKDEIKKEFFRHFDVWKYIEKQIIRYRFFEAVSSSKYCIISSDVFNQPLTTDNFQLFDSCFYDAMGSINGIKMLKFFDSIEEAIKEFEAEFS